jgi:hypothetical protein
MTCLHSRGLPHAAIFCNYRFIVFLRLGNTPSLRDCLQVCSFQPVKLFVILRAVLVNYFIVAVCYVLEMTFSSSPCLHVFARRQFFELPVRTWNSSCKVSKETETLWGRPDTCKNEDECGEIFLFWSSKRMVNIFWFEQSYFIFSVLFLSLIFKSCGVLQDTGQLIK